MSKPAAKDMRNIASIMYDRLFSVSNFVTASGMLVLLCYHALARIVSQAVTWIA
jgi:hypothetical protein